MDERIQNPISMHFLIAFLSMSIHQFPFLQLSESI